VPDFNGYPLALKPGAGTTFGLGIPRSNLLVIENAGPFPWVEQPQAFSEGVRAFLPLLGYKP
jgi:pimeloyl-ACP methyl ester carboxylesterase